MMNLMINWCAIMMAVIVLQRESLQIVLALNVSKTINLILVLNMMILEMANATKKISTSYAPMIVVTAK